MTITLGFSRPAISMASAPSLQVRTALPADLRRYAIRSLLALLSSTTRIRSWLLLKTIPRYDETEDAALSDLPRELDSAAEKPCQALADVEPQARAFPGCCDAELLQLLERFEQL